MKSGSLAAAALSIVLTGAAAAQGEPEQRVALAQAIVGVDYSYAWFQGDIDPWQIGAISLGQRRPGGSFTARVNFARRFATNGAQVEGDACPSLGKKSYAYLNVGYSGSAVFPQWRFGGEMFRTLAGAFETSAGFRQLRFEGNDPVILFTGSIGSHSGNYWYSLRPYLRDRTDGLSASGTVTMRRYYGDLDNWIGTRIGFGSSPGDDLLLSQLNRTGTKSVGLTAARSTSPKAVTTWSFSFEREELSASRSRNHWQAGAGLRLRY